MANFRFNWRGNQVARLVRETAFQAQHDGAEAILTDAIDETPIDTGTLRRSGTVTDAPDDGLTFISFNTPYARYQHENLNLNHPRGGGPKYLENPFNRNKRAVVRLIGLRVRRALRGSR